ncbi:MAG: L,D-transpeptidase [Muribaculaceae bacterium]|nr:L,D-transpeptidase [Muribaculaceae bacterium]
MNNHQSRPLRLLCTFLCLSMAMAVGRAQSSAEGFCPDVERLLLEYGGTRVPMLPDPDGWTDLDSPVSAAPGRMRIPKNIVVDKPNTRLYIINVFSDTLGRYRVCASLKKGQKHRADDWRTPEGTFRIHGVYNSTDWTYKDTNDKCYGPFFISLITPGFWGIGIHGTNSPSSVPGRRSHGCMRMHNEDIVRVRRMVDKDSRVTVLPDPEETPVSQ